MNRVFVLFSLVFMMLISLSDMSFGSNVQYKKGLNGSPAKDMGREVKIIFLHHSTGQNVWNYGKIRDWFRKYNKANNKNYQVEDKWYPKGGNYPYDYWKLWVSGNDSSELKNLAEKYDVIIWKHCFPVSVIKESGNKPEDKTLANYKKQYNELKEKMHEFPDTRFIVWTGAVQLGISETQAKNMRAFVKWVRSEWNENNDNIYIWDFYALETEGGLYLAPKNAKNSSDSHPGKEFCERVAPLLANRIVSVIQGAGNKTSFTGR